MNSSRLRSVSAAPKLAITSTMTVLRRCLSGPNSRRSTPSARPPFSAIAAKRATGSAQPNEKGPIGAARPGKTDPSAPAAASAK